MPRKATKPIPLEDDPCDVIAKAMRGLGISKQDLAKSTGADPTALRAVLNGDNNPDVLEKTAHSLGLSATALTGLFSYQPDISAPAGLNHIVTPFGHAGVNAYIIVHGDCATVLDTGTDAGPILRFADDHHLRITRVIVTHRHPDHIAGLSDFGHVPIIYPENIRHGEEIKTEGDTITALDASGHDSPARAYFYSGLALPVCIVGDSIFAGSMGGTSGTNNYRTALATARQNLMTLPPETILCTGHGPLTTVGLEQRHNPFLNIV